MKNFNETIERIKSLFTEERMFGNLVVEEKSSEEDKEKMTKIKTKKKKKMKKKKKKKNGLPQNTHNPNTWSKSRINPA